MSHDFIRKRVYNTLLVLIQCKNNSITFNLAIGYTNVRIVWMQDTLAD